MDSKATLAELIGTFILVFVGTSTAVVAGLGLLGSGGVQIVAIAFAFGFTLLALVYAIGPISGCLDTIPPERLRVKKDADIRKIR